MSSHWDEVYGGREPTSLSWYEPEPATSLRLIPGRGRVVDVGAGVSTLADRLVERGWDVTLLDVSATALAAVRARLGDRARYVVSDVLAFAPEEPFDVWHDRAVLHFLTSPADAQRYVEVVRASLRPGGAAVVGVFAEDGPQQCSGLPTARYSAVELAQLFGDGFALEHSEREEHVTPWGALQPFTWAVLRRR